MTLTEEIMQVVFAAPDDRKQAALRVLKGEAEVRVAEAVRFSSAGPREAEPFLTLREVGRRLGISTCSLWRYGVPGRAFGGRRRFRMSEVEAFLAGDEFKQRPAAGRGDDRERRARVRGRGRK